MKHNHSSHEQRQKHAAASSSEATPQLGEGLPSHEDVALRAYYSYVNQGSTPGHCEKNWLAAESELVAEHNLATAQGV